ncbi:hypothetical protein [Halochromatium glycolicum]|uniref:hypothetical protein n=1 Tax=Halochromatium glycolicum TaxID=85075 RepID=UPI00190D60A5|nr:hypothetical protein [Halochromatium glycolicum]
MTELSEPAALFVPDGRIDVAELARCGGLSQVSTAASTRTAPRTTRLALAT